MYYGNIMVIMQQSLLIIIKERVFPNKKRFTGNYPVNPY